MSRRRPPKRPGPNLGGQRPRGVRPNTRPRAPIAQTNRRKPQVSAADISLTPAKYAAALPICAICAKSHSQKHTDCPSLILIQRKEADLPVTCCAKCLGFLDQTGQCLKGGECHLVNTRTCVQYNFMCEDCRPSRGPTGEDTASRPHLGLPLLIISAEAARYGPLYFGAQIRLHHCKLSKQSGMLLDTDQWPETQLDSVPCLVHICT